MGQKDFLFSVLEDMTVFAQEHCAVTYGDFYEPQIQYIIEREIGRYPQADCEFWGGHEYSERKMLSVYPKGETADTSEYPLDCIQADNIHSNITHRDVLGAVIGLGIKREKIGDISLNNGELQLFLASPLGEFVEKNINQINIYNVKLKKVGRDNIKVIEPSFITLDVIVPSMRLDAVIHAAYKLSRNEASEYVKAQKVSINHCLTLKPSSSLKEGDVVSVRTKGRMMIGEILGNTHKGNIRLRLKKFA